MILLDPDLDPDPTPDAARASSAVAQVRLPSARTLARFLNLAQAAVRLKGQVSVLLTTDPAIRRLNRQFRGKNKATDVLSFPAGGVGAEEMAGDLAISVPTARRQAAGQNHPLATEIKILMLHGLLHLAGYDHETDHGQMARRERLLRGRLKLPQGLIERVTHAGDPPGPAKNGKQPSPSQKLRAPSLAKAKGGKAQPQRDRDPALSKRRAPHAKPSGPPAVERRSARV